MCFETECGTCCWGLLRNVTFAHVVAFGKCIHHIQCLMTSQVVARLAKFIELLLNPDQTIEDTPWKQINNSQSAVADAGLTSGTGFSCCLLATDDVVESQQPLTNCIFLQHCRKFALQIVKASCRISFRRQYWTQSRGFHSSQVSEVISQGENLRRTNIGQG